MRGKQILAVILIIVNLIVYSTPVGILEVQAANITDESNEKVVEQEEKSEGQSVENTDESEMDSTEESEEPEKESDEKDSEVSQKTDEKVESKAENKADTTDTNEEENQQNQESEEKSIETQQDEIQTMAVSGNYIKLESLEGYKDNNGQKVFEAGENEGDLRLLSHCNPEAIKDITIEFKSTGQLNLTTSTTATVIMEDGTSTNGTYDFIGLGSAEHPFQGTIAGANISIYINHTFFCGLSSKATFSNTLALVWCGENEMPMIADVYQFDSDAQSHTLPVSVTAGTQVDNKKIEAKMGSLLGTVQAEKDFKNQTLNIEKSIIDYNNAVEVYPKSSSGNAGLICETLKSGNICIQSYNMPKEYHVETTAKYNAIDEQKSEAGNAGGLIGVMGLGTSLKLEVEMELNINEVTATGNAGGLVGLMQNGAKIESASGKKVTLKKSIKVKGAVSAGGVAGTADTVTLTGDTGLWEINSPTVITTGDNSNAGGFIGNYSSNTSAEKQDDFPSCINLSSVTVNAGKNGNAGGYFGTLSLCGEGKQTYQIGNNNNETALSLSTIHSSTSYTENTYGAIAGQIISSKIANTVKIQNVTISSIYNDTVKVNYHGGVIGKLGDTEKNAVYLELSNIQTTVTDPYANDKQGFGGMIGCLAPSSILKTSEMIKVTTNGNASVGNNPYIWEGGGIVGNAGIKSVIEFSGITDLSEANFAGHVRDDNEYSGWLVGKQNNSLIYARGDGNGNDWTYKRGLDKMNDSQPINDIGNYGQVIRLKTNNCQTGLNSDLIQINDESHQVNLKALSEGLSWNGNNIIIGSTDDFALLAIAWNSRGNFSADSDNISTDSWKKLCETNMVITLNDNIDLTGTGIGGLSRDTKKSDEDIYAGTLNGNNYTITLAIGEPFGYKRVGTEDKRDDIGLNGGAEMSAMGSCHAAQGLFAGTKDAKIQNLTIGGIICVSNNKQRNSLGSNQIDMIAGGIAGVVSGSTTINNVTASEKIYAEADCKNQQSLSVGGLYGSESGGSLEISGDSRIGAIIDVKNGTTENDGTYTSAGGILGQITSDDYQMTINGLTVGITESDEQNPITITSDAKKYAYIGGLVGVIKSKTTEDSDKVQKPNGTLSATRCIKIKNLAFKNYKVSAEKATSVSGGLFGSNWMQVGVYFQTPENQNVTAALKVESSSVNAPNASGVGGLAYRSSGIWEINDKGIDMSSEDSLTINSKGDVGILVCRGEMQDGNRADKKKEIGALYLVTKKHWSSSYLLNQNSLSVTQKSGVFDEFVAHTAYEAKNITDMDKNGVISIATQDTENGRVGVDVLENQCTTYQNRTTYGQKKTNGCSRYYYDLDQCVTDAKNDASYNNNQNIDTPEELLLWSVYKYAYENIKTLISPMNEDGTYAVPDSVRKGTSNNLNRWWIRGHDSLDMEKYSYYPVSVTDGTTDIRDVTIQFHNEEIQQAEKSSNNKSTQGTQDAHTQHYGMHCGLLYNYQTVGGTLILRNVTFTGTVGMMNNGSGALIANESTGYITSQGNKVKIDLQSVTLDGVKVYDMPENGYAPLLINKIGSAGYSELKVDDLKSNSSAYKSSGQETFSIAGSSLIGQVGKNDANAISLAFTKITLPDEAGNSIFSRATLLDSFTYAGSSSTGTYNFFMEEDANNNHTATYGNEIKHSIEYDKLQWWYYDEIGYGHDTNKVPVNENENYYLPYVYTKYNVTNCTHELRVNQRVANIIDGCGTYGHPYVITTDQQMITLATYMSTGSAPDGWAVRITTDQSAYCSKNDEKDVIYRFYKSDGQWKQVTKSGDTWTIVPNKTSIENSVMLQYLLNAYYDLQGTQKENSTEYELNLSSFGGFGSETNPFRGVLTSTKPTTVVFSGANIGNGLIQYSYGSVVKDLKLAYKETQKLLTYKTNSGAKYSSACFGGVIGSVLGGDNIIDNVTVNMEGECLILSGEKNYLIQVGGYVGSVSGGGVIFRNIPKNCGLGNLNISAESQDTKTSSENSEEEQETEQQSLNPSSLLQDIFKSAESKNAEVTSSMVSGNDYLYVNPYVGRVLDGFAFYEKTSSDDNVEIELNNSNKNYQVNTLDTSKTKCVTSSESVINVANNQGLLILAAVINSGVTSGGVSNAYSNTKNTKNATVNGSSYNFAGNYGKVRNANYSHIGSGTADDEVKTAKSDDYTVLGQTNSPYLLQKYCDTGLWNIIASGITINLIPGKNDNQNTYDMSSYGNGYQGISARYASNATVQGEKGNAATSVVPEIATFNGNGKTVILPSMQVLEYEDDDFHAASVGGIFNLLRVGTSECTIENLTIEGKKDNTSSKAEISLKYINGISTDSKVGVGAVAGAISGLSASKSIVNSSAKFTSVKVQNLLIDGPVNTGGFMGSSFRTEKLGDTTDLGTRIDWLIKGTGGTCSVGIHIENSGYENLQVTAQNAAGGFVGYIDSELPSSISTVISTTNTTSEKERVMGKNTTIGKTGNTTTYAGGAFGYIKSNITINADESKSYSDAVMQDITVTASDFAGGFIGKIDNKTYDINQAVLKRSSTGENADVSTSVKKMADYNKDANDRNEGAGGIVGWATGTGDNNKITNCRMENAQINKNETATNQLNQNQEGSGGIIGVTAGGKVTIQSCKMISGKVYGAVAGGIAGIANATVVIDECIANGNSKTKKSDVKGYCTASGILGFWRGQLLSNISPTVTVQNCKAQYLDISGINWGVGALIGDSESKYIVGKLYVFNCAVADTIVTANGNSWCCAGGITGDLRSDVSAANLLFSNTEIISNKSAGWLFGIVVNDPAIHIAGISIQKISEGNETLSLYGTAQKNEITNDYVAFADYSGASVENLDKQPLKTTRNLLNPDVEDDKKNQLTEEFPYTITSPKSSMFLGETNKERYLYGDGVAWSKNESGDYAVEANEIWENRNKVEKGRYAYNNIKLVGDPDASKNFNFSFISTYNANQSADIKDTNEKVIEKHQVDKDFPVVQISGGDTDTVTDYLNIITNGAFSEANNIDTSKSGIVVSATTNVYTYQSGRFVKDETAVSAFRVNTNTTGKISFSTTTDYDNGKDRFTLLTVTFTEKDADGNSHSYHVFVPILVRRMLEMDFTATLTYGTDFNSADYSNLSTHVLESFGSSITGFLTYTYNSAGDADGEHYIDYGWQSYINAGGNLNEMKKSIQFNMSNPKTLPKGTQLTLIDAESKKAYYYTAKGEGDNSTGEEVYENGGINIPLNSFVASDGETHYQEPSISELLKVIAEPDANGLFVKVNADGKPDNADASKEYPEATIKIKNAEKEYEYYRLADASLNETGAYSISVDEDDLYDDTDKNNLKSTIKESYYLVVTVPKIDEDIMLNGSIQTTVTSKIPHQIHYQKLVKSEDEQDKKNGYIDVHENTASTYNLSNGYQQRLTESGNDGNSKQISMTSSQMKVDITDKITFPTEQLYKNYDELYMKFVGGLQRTESSSSSSSAEQFPSGTTGEAKFYVYTKDEKDNNIYYIYNNGQWESTEEKQVAVNYDWVSNGEGMDLPLSVDGTTAISLHTLRDSIVKSGKTGNADFYVQLMMEVNLPPAGLDVVPESQLESGNPKDYIKLSYSSRLSTVQQSLSYSNNRASVVGTTAYYREPTSGVKLTYDADKVDQLGINLLDLIYLDSSGKNSQIDTTATYDMLSMNKLEETLKDSTGIRFTLSLCPKNTNENNEDYAIALTDADKYISVELKSKDSGTVTYSSGNWSWTVPKTTYYDTEAGKLNMNDIFDGSKLIQLIRLKVNIANVEEIQHYYSNYKVVLTAEILDKNGNVIDATRDTDSIIYTMTKIRQEFKESEN